MYAQNYFSLFPPFPRNNNVFVAISFDDRFKSRWENVIKPAFEEQINGVLLKPYRVDLSNISDSILTDILEGIRSSRIILGDITTIGEIGGIPVCNNNVMYEIGIAQSIRLPEEVVLFSSDKYEGDLKIPFDLSHIRVNPYDPDENSEKASKHLRKIIIECLSKIDQNKSLFVKHAAERLDYDCWLCLFITGASLTKTVDQPVIRTHRDEMNYTSKLKAISRLLELGMLTAQSIRLDSNIIELSILDVEKVYKYRMTPFGEVVFEYAKKNISFLK